MTIRGGVDFIARQQLWSGGFVSYRLHEPGSNEPKSYETTFAASVIGLALENVRGCSEIKQHICRFLLAQASESWSWNYWDRSSRHAQHMAYPDDLDDTFLALRYIAHQQPDVLSPQVLAAMSQQLFLTEEQPGGPYRTWLVSDDIQNRWQDVDTVVNSNVAAFLADQGVRLPALTKLTERAMRQGAFDTRYYPPLFPAVYFTARWYDGRYKNKLKKLIEAYQILGTWETPHRTAMAVSSLLRLGCHAQDVAYAVDFIKKTQRIDGSWQAGSMYKDSVQQGDIQVYYVGAESLTTALCLEALSLYEDAVVAAQYSQESNGYYEKVTTSVAQKMTAIQSKELRLSVDMNIRRVLERDGDKQIILLPWMVAAGFGCTVDDELLSRLGEMNVWGWAAYTIFDDFLDYEGDPKTLPGAVFAVRTVHDIIAKIMPKNASFRLMVSEVFERIDTANAWETQYCRGTRHRGRLYIKKLPDYGDYWQLVDRSLGHALSGAAVLTACGYTKESPEIMTWMTFFRHFIIARQLNDDAHDWEDDLSRLHINAVAVRILDIWQRDEQHDLAKDGVHLSRDSEKLRTIMWSQVIDTVVADIRSHCDQARQAAESMPDGRQLLSLLQSLEAAAEQALTGRNDAQEFIDAL